MNPSTRRSGFTLIELLVVVAIIAILASLLFPALTRAKWSAHMAACTSNLRQMGISVQVYATDHNDAMPLIGERYWGAPPIRGLVGSGHGWSIHGILLTRTGIPIDAFRCPADRREYELTEENFFMIGPGVVYEEVQFDYPANAVGHGLRNRRLPWSLPPTSPNPGGELKHSMIPNPSDLFLIWDGHMGMWTQANGWAQLRTGFDIVVPKGGVHFETTFRHAELIKLEDGTPARDGKKGPNVVLADGHVERRINMHNGPWSDDNFNLEGF